MTVTAPEFGRVPAALGPAGFVAKMTGADAKVYLALASHNRRARAEDGKCWPSVETLVEETGLSQRTIFRATRRLAEMGLLSITGGGGRGHRRTYYVIGNPGTPVTLSEAETLTPRALNPDTTCAETLTPRALEVEKGRREKKKGSTARRQKTKRQQCPVTWNATDARFIVSPELLARWHRDYPHLDIDRELVKAANWTAVNPPKKGHARFLVNWLNRCAEPREAKPEPPRKAWRSGYTGPTETVGPKGVSPA